MTIYSLDIFLSQFLTNLLFHGRSNCCFLTCIQISQEADKVVWCSHLSKNFPQFAVIHTVKGFSVVSEAEVDVILELSCFFFDPTDIDNLISGSSAFSKSSLNIWKFMVHILLKPRLENFEHYLLEYEMSALCSSLSTLWHCLSLRLKWKLTFSCLWPLLSFPNLLAYGMQHFHSIIF